LIEQLVALGSRIVDIGATAAQPFIPDFFGRFRPLGPIVTERGVVSIPEFADRLHSVGRLRPGSCDDQSDDVGHRNDTDNRISRNNGGSAKVVGGESLHRFANRCVWAETDYLRGHYVANAKHDSLLSEQWL